MEQEGKEENGEFVSLESMCISIPLIKQGVDNI